MSQRTLRLWFLVHKWTSLVCTLFLLLLCLTGLPLVFWEEISHATGGEPDLAPVAAGTPRANVDAMLRRALAQSPGHVPLFVSWDDHAPLVYVTTGARTNVAPADMRLTALHEFSGALVPVPQFNDGVMFFLYRLHTDLFLGLGGMLFMGAMALLFAAAVVSGVVLYAPFMRKLRFGTFRTFRTGRSRRLAWLDLHNLLGIVTVAWVLVVGLTGAINTLAEPLQQSWQADQLGEFAGRYAGTPRPKRLSSVHAAIEAARAAAPDLVPSFVSYPGTGYSGDHHYGVFMRGTSPLTERIARPVLVDVRTGAITAQPRPPLAISVLLLSQPLHFGDYAGLPLKILWALLDLATIVVLVSGLVLWLRRGSTDARLAELARLRRATGVAP